MRALMLAALWIGLSCPGLADEAQPNRMKTCNADAARQELKGDDRRQFMSRCLSTNKGAAKEAVKKKEAVKSDDQAPANKERKLTAQQIRMQTCNAEAKPQALKKDAYRQFMKACLSAR